MFHLMTNNPRKNLKFHFVVDLRIEGTTQAP